MKVEPRQATVRLESGAEARLEIPSDLEQLLSQAQTQANPGRIGPLKSTEDVSLQKAAEFIRRDPTLIADFELKLTPADRGGPARLVGLNAPFYRKLVSLPFAKQPGVMEKIDRFNAAFVLAKLIPPQDAKGLTVDFLTYTKLADDVERSVSLELLKAARDQTPGHEERFEDTLEAAAGVANDNERVMRRAEEFGEKVTYAANDVFQTFDYDKMLGNVRRVAGFYGRSRLDLIGVGVMVGPNLVLTCQHVVVDPRMAVATLRSFSDPLLKDLDREFTIKKVVQPGKAGNLDVDLALVEIEQRSGPNLELKEKLMVEAAPLLNVPLYILAMHRDNKIAAGVYDSASVLFPASVKGRDIAKLYKDIRIGLQTRQRYESDLDEAGLLKDFLRCYGLGTAIEEMNLDTTYYYQRTYQDGKKRKVFGFGTDTVRGNSGGGIFDKTDGNLVGMMSRGVSGNGMERTADWAKHEMGVPGEVVQEFLKVYEAATAKDPSLPKAEVTYQ